MEIRLIGLVDPKIISKFSNMPKLELDNDFIFFVDYANCDIPIGHTFTKCYKIDNGVCTKFVMNVKIKYVTQQYDRPFSIIPKGWKTIVIFHFFTSPPFFHEIPFLDSWDDKSDRFIVLK